MKIFRGPSSVPFPDEAHELVATSDLSKMTTIGDGAVLLCANVTKQPNERQALAHIELEFDDIVALQGKMIGELLNRSKELDALRDRVIQAREDILKIFNFVCRLDEEEIDLGLRQKILDLTDEPLELLEPIWENGRKV